MLAQALGSGPPAQLRQLSIPFFRVVSFAMAFAGIVLFVMLLIGGFKYITSGGDPKAAAAAQQTITYAIVGIIVIATSYLVLSLLSTFTGVPSILNFNVYR
jgi:hypothetical protein